MRLGMLHKIKHFYKIKYVPRPLFFGDSQKDLNFFGLHMSTGLPIATKNMFRTLLQFYINIEMIKKRWYPFSAICSHLL